MAEPLTPDEERELREEVDLALKGESWVELFAEQVAPLLATLDAARVHAATLEESVAILSQRLVEWTDLAARYEREAKAARYEIDLSPVKLILEDEYVAARAANEAAERITATASSPSTGHTPSITPDGRAE